MKPSKSKRWTRDEIKAREWAAIAVQYHQRMEAKGQPIPFPDVCFCIGVAHKYGEAPDRREVTREGSKGVVATICPVISRKTHTNSKEGLQEVADAR